IQSRMASRKTGLQVTPRSPSGSALATCRLIAKSCLNNRIRYIFLIFRGNVTSLLISRRIASTVKSTRRKCVWWESMASPSAS
ncbi:MAG: hypothetical protein VB124_02575, partial [Burkholderia sp.]